MNRKPITLAAMAIASMAMITLSSCNGNTQSNNENDADSTAIVNENVEAPAVSDDEIKDFITTMYNDYLYGEEEFLREYCTDKMMKKLADEYEYDGEGLAKHILVMPVCIYVGICISSIDWECIYCYFPFGQHRV